VAVVIELGEIVDVTCSFAVHTVHLYFFFIDPCLMLHAHLQSTQSTYTSFLLIHAFAVRKIMTAQASPLVSVLIKTVYSDNLTWEL